MGELVKYTDYRTVDISSTEDIPPGQIIEVHVSAVGIETLSAILPDSMTALLVSFEQYVAQLALRESANVEIIGAEFRKDTNSIVVQARSKGVPVPLVVAAIVGGAAIFGFSWLFVREIRIVITEAPVAAVASLGTLAAIIGILAFLSGE